MIQQTDENRYNSIMHYGVQKGCVDFNYLFYVKNGKPNMIVRHVLFVT